MKIRKADNKDILKLSDVMSLAFAQERFHRWLFKDEKTCVKRGRELFIFMAQRYLKEGLFLTNDELTAAALCMPPHKRRVSFVFEAVQLLKMVKIFRAKFFFMLKVFKQVEQFKPKEPHLYLEVIGVHPSCQRQGKGTFLLRHIINLCDQNHWMAYLESPEYLVPYYERFGFKVRDIFEIPQADMKIYTMSHPAGI